jgi:glucose 1-dehydrogenase
MSGRLTGQVAIVTGASRGIGLATAIALGKAGVRVVLNYLDTRDELERGLAEIRAAGSDADVFQADVADAASGTDLVAFARQRFGQLNIVVTNAAFSDREPFYQAQPGGFRRTIDVTMWGAFHVAQAGAQAMIEQGRGGSIVAVSSPHAYIPAPNSMAYNMAKAALDQMARTAAVELAAHRIRVNLVYPGWIDTPGERKFTSEADLTRLADQLPWKRLGRPDEVARAVLFFCDPASDYITGSSLLVDGGITLPWWRERIFRSEESQQES